MTRAAQRARVSLRRFIAAMFVLAVALLAALAYMSSGSSEGSFTAMVVIALVLDLLAIAWAYANLVRLEQRIGETET